MAHATRVPRDITAEEYLVLERRASFKSEFLDGQIYAMSGASPEHSTIMVNLYRVDKDYRHDYRLSCR